MTTFSTDEFDPSSLPVPYDALLELGMTDEEIRDAWERRPLVNAFQAHEREGAYFSVAHAARALKAIESFKHTKGRWGNSPLKLQTWQKVWVVFPIFGWLWYDDEVGRDVRVTRWVSQPSPLASA
jgi:hypothetical protein